MRDKCSVNGCRNNRRNRERNIVMGHVKQLKFHKCPDNFFNVWTWILGWKDKKVDRHTAVCSNHFKHGEPFKVDPHPTLYLGGYDPDAAAAATALQLLMKQPPVPPDPPTSFVIPPILQETVAGGESENICSSVSAANGHKQNPHETDKPAPDGGSANPDSSVCVTRGSHYTFLGSCDHNQGSCPLCLEAPVAPVDTTVPNGRFTIKWKSAESQWTIVPPKSKKNVAAPGGGDSGLIGTNQKLDCTPLVNGHDYTPHRMCDCQRVDCWLCTTALVKGLREQVWLMTEDVLRTSRQLEEAEDASISASKKQLEEAKATILSTQEELKEAEESSWGSIKNLIAARREITLLRKSSDQSPTSPTRKRLRSGVSYSVLTP